MIVPTGHVSDRRRAGDDNRPVTSPPTTPVTETVLPSVEVAHPRLHSLVIAADAAAVAVGLFVAHAILEHGADIGSAPGLTGVYGLLAVAWLGSLAINRLYQARCVEQVGEEIRRLFVAGAMSIGTMLAIGYIADTTQPTRSWVIGVFAVVTMALLIDRTIARALFAHLRSAGVLTRRVAIIGTDDRASALAHDLADDPRLGYTVAGFVGPIPSTHDGECRWLGGLEQVGDVLVANECIGGIVSVASLRQDQVNMITRRLVERGLHAELSTNLRDIDLTRIRLQSIDGQVLLYIEPIHRNGWRAMLKRLLDLSVAIVVLILALPMMMIAAVLVKIDSPGPVLFRQRRVGRNGDPFEMLKLRTMCVDAESQRHELLPLNEAGGPMFKIKDDPRLTRVGRWLRRLSIDELPQLWNVIRGEMSVVGPRPALPHEVAEWDRDLYQRLTVPPGITGMWQVSGRSDATFDQYRRLDLYYVDNWSLLHDLQVMAKTIWVVLTARGAS